MNSVVSFDNATFVRPLTFYVNGFYNMPNAKYYHIFLCFVYAVTVLGNSFIIGTIYLARPLHTAKYIAVLNLALSDLCGSSAVIPKYTDMFLFDHQYISYEDCLANMFFVFLFMTLQSFSLLALAFDRVIAICFPLRYHAIVSKTTMSLIIGVIWIFSVAFITLLVALITRLSFCRTTVVGSYFCDHGPIFRIACNDNFPNRMMSYLYSGIVLCIPLLLTVLSYVFIGVTLLKLSRGAERMKAMKTCTSHIILVSIFYFPIVSIYCSTLTTYVHPDTRIINSALTQTIPPMLNPIIYSLKTEEVLQSIKMLFKRYKVSSGMDANITIKISHPFSVKSIVKS